MTVVIAELLDGLKLEAPPPLETLLAVARSVRVLSACREHRHFTTWIMDAVRKGCDLSPDRHEYTDPCQPLRDLFDVLTPNSRERAERILSAAELDAFEEMPVRRRMTSFGSSNAVRLDMLRERRMTVPTAREAFTYLIMMSLLAPEHAYQKKIWCHGIDGRHGIIQLVEPDVPGMRYDLNFWQTGSTAAEFLGMQVVT